MIPIGDSVRSRTFPFVNVAIIAVNLLVFVYEVMLSQDTVLLRGGVGTRLDEFIYDWGNIPACTADAFGRHVLAARSAICQDQPEPRLTIFTAMFMHGSWLHVAGNMLFLWIFGDNIEDAMGHVRYAVFYVVGGALASFAHGVVDIDSVTPAIGASGAIASVMAAYLVLYPRATVRVVFGFVIIPMPVPAWVMIGFWFFGQLLYGFSSLGNVDAVGAGGGIAYFAHIGGFVAGAVLVNVFVIGRRAWIRRGPGFRDAW